MEDLTIGISSVVISSAHHEDDGDDDDEDQNEYDGDDVQVYSAGRRALIEERQKREPSRLERLLSSLSSLQCSTTTFGEIMVDRRGGELRAFSLNKR